MIIFFFSFFNSLSYSKWNSNSLNHISISFVRIGRPMLCAMLFILVFYYCSVWIYAANQFQADFSIIYCGVHMIAARLGSSHTELCSRVHVNGSHVTPAPANYSVSTVCGCMRVRWVWYLAWMMAGPTMTTTRTFPTNENYWITSDTHTKRQRRLIRPQLH